MKEQKNWAYGVEINGIGTIFYGRDYFARDGIVNPVSATPYTKEEIAAILKNAADGAEGYTACLPENAVLGMNGFWYDAAGAAAGKEVAAPIAK